MSDLCRLIWSAVIGLFRSRAALQAEVLFLRHQLNVLRRKSPRRVALNNIDRLVLTGRYYLAPQLRDALKIVKPETVIRFGIALVSEPIGAGNRDRTVVGRGRHLRSDSSFAT